MFSWLIWWKKLDWFLIINILFLNLFSLAALYSLTSQENMNWSNLFIRQAFFILLGFALHLLISRIDYRISKNYNKIFFLFVFILLALVLIAEPIRGVSSWFAVFGQTFQPAEFAKLAIVFFLAKYLSEKSKVFYLWRHVLWTGLVVAVIAAMVAQQPDFGSAFIIFCLWLVAILMTKINWRQVLTIFGVIIVGGFIIWNSFLQPYQQARIMSFINPEQDAQSHGYNVQQAIIAVGSGQVLGKGLGLGTQSQLNFLPEQYSDFIFAVIAESFGWWGVLLLLSLYLVFFWRLLNAVREGGDPYGTWMLLCFFIYLSVQTIINIGMNIGILPVTGITLPFVSYGGSSLVTSYIALGLIQSYLISKKEKLFVYGQSKEF
ncbi:MAG: hypothetical protein COX77_00170 [Candidatus Komeilibacteria bacterium CG_4_10_14_0_2_um_filter_37_10]|uniref:Rod shape-determining protein RodA n=1 Tax=Candidatus Komeilibacteria bacterium CG_4_10_14_0_2_um_filter_37_10 TaxID=1974470 RepID=A0A2M7VGR6_9BACT|nr:MAG: hypothetical protein COX77_00170 [Candidatus Komeilibacteria bacterium CG_4_10_14_0_2_um_filter_37_10]